MAENAVKQLLDLKQQIEVDKERKARLEGKLASLMERLKKDFDCGSVEDAEIKLEDLNRRASELETTIQVKIDEIRREYTSRA